MPVEDSGGCILFWQLEALCNGLLTLPSPHTFQFPSTPRRVQFANRNPLFYLKLGVPGCSWLLSTGKETTSLDSSWCQV